MWDFVTGECSYRLLVPGGRVLLGDKSSPETKPSSVSCGYRVGRPSCCPVIKRSLIGEFNPSYVGFTPYFFLVQSHVVDLVVTKTEAAQSDRTALIQDNIGKIRSVGWH
jgi:hypothetical protein